MHDMPSRKKTATKRSSGPQAPLGVAHLPEGPRADRQGHTAVHATTAGAPISVIDTDPAASCSSRWPRTGVARPLVRAQFSRLRAGHHLWGRVIVDDPRKTDVPAGVPSARLEDACPQPIPRGRLLTSLSAAAPPRHHPPTRTRPPVRRARPASPPLSWRARGQDVGPGRRPVLRDRLQRLKFGCRPGPRPLPPQRSTTAADEEPQDSPGQQPLRTDDNALFSAVSTLRP